jgi:hypothetical protein
MGMKVRLFNAVGVHHRVHRLHLDGAGGKTLFKTQPFYYSSAPSFLPTLSDSLLTVLAPVPASRLTAASFHILDLAKHLSLISTAQFEY